MSKTINEALRNLFLELGGNSSELADNSKISDYIDDLVDVLGNGGGASIFNVEFATEDDETFTCNKTFEEIKEAYDNGSIIRASVSGSSYLGVDCSTSNFLIDETGATFYFLVIVHDNDGYLQEIWDSLWGLQISFYEDAGEMKIDGLPVNVKGRDITPEDSEDEGGGK